MKRVVLPFLILVSLVAVSAAFAQSAVETPAPVPTGAEIAPAATIPAEMEVMMELARTSIERSENLNNNMGTLLNFLEVVGSLAALAIAVGAVFGISSLRELREDVTKQVREELKPLTNDLDQAIKKLDSQFGNERKRLLDWQENFGAEITANFQALTKDREAVTKETKKFEDITSSFSEVIDYWNRAIRALTLVQLGEQQMQRTNLRAAMSTFQEAYHLDSENRAVNYYLGELYIMERDLDQAEMHLKRAQPQMEAGVFPPALAALGYVMRLKGDRIFETEHKLVERNILFNDAEGFFLHALRADESVRDINGESVYGMLGALYRQWGRIDEAVECYMHAVRITPDRSYPLNNLAMLQYSRGKVEDAMKYFDHSIELAKQRIDNNPMDHWARFDLITAQLACARRDIAREKLEATLETVQMPGPLESFLTGLLVLANAPHPPEDIEYFLDRVKDRIEVLKAPGEEDFHELDAD